jgi:hypothetical protein
MPIQELEMTSPYLQPFVALAMALPQLLEKGYRLELVSGYGVASQDRFAAIWTK